MARIKVRTGMPSVQLTRQEFAKRFRERFHDPAFAGVEAEIEKIIGTAWEGYRESQKAPRVHLAGPGFANPGYELSVEWLEAGVPSARPSAGRRIRKGAHASCSSTARRAPTRPVRARSLRRSASRRSPARCSGRSAALMSISSISAGSLPNTAARSISARPASLRPCHYATGHAPAIPITRSGRSTTGWPRSIQNGWRRMG
jgi:hypothetical protein